MTGGSGSPPEPPDLLWATGLPWSSGESSDAGVGAVATTGAGASPVGFVPRLDFLLDLDTPSSPPARFFFLGRSAATRESSEAATWLLAVCSVAGAWPDGVGIGPYAPGGGG